MIREKKMAWEFHKVANFKSIQLGDDLKWDHSEKLSSPPNHAAESEVKINNKFAGLSSPPRLSVQLQLVDFLNAQALTVGMFSF